MAAVQDWSLYSIPAAFTLAMLPQAYMSARLASAAGGRLPNTAPRGNLENLKGRIPEDLWQHFYRARSAHINALENFPLFVAAVLAGRMVGLSPAYLSSLSLQYLVGRTIYTLLYVNTRSQTLSWLRTITFFVSLSFPMRMLLAAGSKAN